MNRAAVHAGETRRLGLLSFALFLATPVVLAVAVAAGQWRIALAIAPLLVAEWYADRAWLESRGQPDELELTPEEDDDLAHSEDGWTDSLLYVLDHPEVVARYRFAYRFSLRACVLARPLHWAGFTAALLLLPQYPLLAAVGAFVGVATDTSGSSKLAALALPRLRVKADDEERKVWLRWYGRLDNAGVALMVWRWPSSTWPGGTENSGGRFPRASGPTS